ncbi:hypothetical protein [Cellvibrio sp. UBA7661]|uniref:hypothetical protein n=1 Tax=Cellvibrio sp. UBA7661 TaxID=1946311 RepID=UPI002F35A3B7
MKSIPIPVWLICLYFGLSAAWGFYVYISYLLGIENSNSELNVILETYMFFDYAVIFTKLTITISACILLFLLKKVALYFFYAKVVIAITSVAWFWQKTDVIESIGIATFLIVNVAMGVGVWVAVCFYVHNLIKKGVLN